MSVLTPASPKVAPLPAPPPAPPKQTDQNVSQAYQDARRRAANIGSRNNMVLTGSGGLANTPVTTAGKSLLGI